MRSVLVLLLFCFAQNIYAENYQKPIANNDAISTLEDTPVAYDVVDNDAISNDGDESDVSIDRASVDLNAATSERETSVTLEEGSFDVNDNGEVLFTPTPNFFGEATLSYTIKNDAETPIVSEPAVITVTVESVNDAPVATSDEVATVGNAAVPINVLENDIDIDGRLDPSTLNVSATAGGTFTNTGAGIVVFSPDKNFQGLAKAVYLVNDNEGAASNAADISVTVTAESAAPVANNDVASTDKNVAVVIKVLDNDTDADADIDATSVVITNANGGTFAANSSGDVTFTPNTDFTGSATASYTVNDLSGSTSNAATITVTVTAVNAAPVASNDAASTNEDQPVTLDLLANDTDSDGSIDKTSVVLTNGTGGTFSVDATGVLTYTPTVNFNGSATVNYTVKDNTGATSNVATVTITVNAVNDPPIANNDNGTTSEDQSVVINVVSNDTDVDGNVDATTVSLSNASGGTFVADASGGVTFTPQADFTGTATSNYTVKDNGGAASNVATISVTVNAVNDPPVANNDEGSTNEDVAVTINVTSNDADTDGTINPGTVSLSNAIGGTFVADALGNVTYTPQLNFNGSASARYTVKDNNGTTSNEATITITVAPVSDGPIASNDVGITNEDQSVSLNILANDVNSDGTIDPSTVQINSISGGTFSVAAGIVTFVPTQNFNGVASAKYTVKDSNGATSNEATISVTVLAVNDPPVANNDEATTNEEVAITISVVSNDSDVDGTINATTVIIDPNVSGGTFTPNSAGVVTFTPQINFVGTATATYTVKDNLGEISNHATITIMVNGVNDPPIARNDVTTTNEDVAVTLTVLSNDTDDDGSLNIASVVISNVSAGSFVANSTGQVVFTPPLDFNGIATANYTVKDNEGATSNMATITVTVTNVEDAPVALNDEGVTNENAAVSVAVTANDTDPDGTVNAATVDLNVTVPGIQNTFTNDAGVFTADAAGNVSYTPAGGFNGLASVKYTVNDNSGKTSNEASISITVNAVNDPPHFDVIPDQRVLINAPEKLITITNISAGPKETEQLLLTATSGNTALIPDPKVTYNGSASTATLSFKPAANVSGVAAITVKLVDSGLNEYTQTFQIEVVDVQITSVPDSIAEVGESYEYVVSVTDIPETLTLEVSQKPAWLTFTALGKNKAKLTGVAPEGSTNAVVHIQLKDLSNILDDQQFVLIINHRPLVKPFGITANEDESRQLSASEFESNFSDADGQTLRQIQFTRLPRHGTLTLNGVPLSIEVTVASASIAAIAYTSPPEYSGPDTLQWKGSDGYSYSANSASMSIAVAPVNDAPVVTMESDSLVYEVGNEVSANISTAFNVTDVDDEFLASAEIGFERPNFQPAHDILEFINTPNISGVYNSEIGILSLTGEATVQEYAEAIRSIKYNYIDLQDLSLQNRKIYVTMSDGKSTSDVKRRTIDLFYTFAALDIPNGFTPNGDNANDFWKITSSKGVEQYEKALVRVFNKRGEVVFETIGFDKPWDGTLNGKVLLIDTYYYTIDLQYNKIRYKGIVTILR